MIYLIDASVYVFRAYYSMPPEMTDRDGNPAHATFGFARFLGDLIERVKPHYMAVAFDESLTTSFRNQIYPAYKANREPPPADCRQQTAASTHKTNANRLVALAHWAAPRLASPRLVLCAPSDRPDLKIQSIRRPFLRPQRHCSPDLGLPRLARRRPRAPTTASSHCLQSRAALGHASRTTPSRDRVPVAHFRHLL